tara:strand:- start:152 stop:811 length:660 start_codon:yes stop_codon:yes gene_type:complete
MCSRFPNRIPVKDLKVGMVIKTSRSGDCTILCLGYDRFSAKVKFHNTGYVLTGVPRVRISDGCIKDPYARLNIGLGYTGTKELKFTESVKEAYVSWSSMLRVSEENGHKVAHEWLSLKNFSDWYYKTKPNDDFLMVKNPVSTIYCKQTCIFTDKENAKRIAMESVMVQASVVDSNGDFYEFKSAARFAKNHNLPVKSFTAMLRGEQKSCGGFSKFNGQQ